MSYQRLTINEALKHDAVIWEALDDDDNPCGWVITYTYDNWRDSMPLRAKTQLGAVREANKHLRGLE